MTEPKVTIGHIARAAGVNIETVRYYQRRGLVVCPLKECEDFVITRLRQRVGCVLSSARRRSECRSKKYSA